MPSVDHTLEIAAEPAAILAAFFDPGALGRWWRVERSVTTPRILGVYPIQPVDPTGAGDSFAAPVVPREQRLRDRSRLGRRAP